MVTLSQRRAEYRAVAVMRSLQHAVYVPAPDLKTLSPSARWVAVRADMARYIADNMPGEDDTDNALDRLRQYRMPWSESAYNRIMDGIRDAGIALYEDEYICNDGLNKFLEAFGLDRFDEICGNQDYSCEDSDCERCNPEREYMVTATVTVSFRVTTTNSEYDVQRDVERYLSVEYAGDVDDIETETWHVDDTRNVHVEACDSW